MTGRIAAITMAVYVAVTSFTFGTLARAAKCDRDARVCAFASIAWPIYWPARAGAWVAQ